LTDEEVGLFISGRLQPAELQHVVRHLLEGCPECRTQLSVIAEMLTDSAPPVGAPSRLEDRAYDRAIDRAIIGALRQESFWERERAQLDHLLTAAEESPGGISGIVEEAEANLHGWPLVEALLRLSYETRFRDVHEMLFLAFAARVAAQNLDSQKYGATRIADIRARAWAELGNAYRLNDQFDSAEDAFARAEALLDEGTGDALLLARVLNLQASLRTDQRRLGAAIEMLDLVYRLYIEMGESHLAGRALLKKGINVRNDGRPEEAVALLEQGLAEIDPRRDPKLEATGVQALLDAMVDSGRHREAAQVLLGSNLRQSFAEDPLNLARLRWVEGKIFAGLGKLRRAERIFREVREGFLDRDQEYDAALVGLELAGVWLQQERAEEVRDLAQEILEVFEDLGIQSEAVKAIRYLNQACARSEATPGLVHRILAFLLRLEWEPRLQFAP
jgi:tetratricopeptide (TPR) repeat protein